MFPLNPLLKVSFGMHNHQTERGENVANDGFVTLFFFPISIHTLKKGY